MKPSSHPARRRPMRTLAIALLALLGTGSQLVICNSRLI